MTWPIRLRSAMTSESKKVTLSAKIMLDATEPFHEVITEEFARSEIFVDLIYEVAECHIDRFLSDNFKHDIYRMMSIEDYYIDDYYISTFDCYMQIDAVVTLAFESQKELNKFKLSNPDEYQMFSKMKVID